ncbi:hypothetical protein BHQ16_02110 [Mycobacterium shimoidei]|nr:hypothetical protein BHQ16_02110 [Mycobacterium shimoidei]
MQSPCTDNHGCPCQVSVTIEIVTTAIVVTLMLVAVGIVVDQLARLSKWLKQPPPDRDAQPPDEQP